MPPKDPGSYLVSLAGLSLVVNPHFHADMQTAVQLAMQINTKLCKLLAVTKRPAIITDHSITLELYKLIS